jgi:hypothetical protein
MGRAALLHERDTFQARPKGEGDRSCPKSPCPKKFSSAIAAPERRDAWPTPPAVRLREDFLAIEQRWLSLARSTQLWSEPGRPGRNGDVTEGG